MVREISGAKINPKSSFKNEGAQNKRGRKLREQIRYTIRILTDNHVLLCHNFNRYFNNARIQGHFREK